MDFLIYCFLGLVTLGLIFMLIIYATEKNIRSGVHEGLINISLFVFSVAFILSLAYYLGKFIFPLIMNLFSVKFPL